MVQETHFQKKGTFQMNNFQIFECIRKNKEKGGTLIGIHSSLNPILVSEYDNMFELIVVETSSAQLRQTSGGGLGVGLP